MKLSYCNHLAAWCRWSSWSTCAYFHKKRERESLPHLPPQVSRSYLLNSQLPSVIQKGNDCFSIGNSQKLQHGNKTLTSIWWKKIRFLWSSKGIEQNTNKRNACIAIYSCFHSSIEYFNCSKCQGWQHNKRYDRLQHFYKPRHNILGWVPRKWGICTSHNKTHRSLISDHSASHRNLVTQSFPFSGALWPQPPLPSSSFTCLNRPTQWVVHSYPHRPAHTGFTPTIWDLVYAYKISSAVSFQCYHILVYLNLVKPQAICRPDMQESLLILYWLLKSISHSHFMRSFRPY